jgi:hypothetical protein
VLKHVLRKGGLLFDTKLITEDAPCLLRVFAAYAVLGHRFNRFSVSREEVNDETRHFPLDEHVDVGIATVLEARENLRLHQVAKFIDPPQKDFALRIRLVG